MVPESLDKVAAVVRHNTADLVVDAVLEKHLVDHLRQLVVRVAPLDATDCNPQ